MGGPQLLLAQPMLLVSKTLGAKCELMCKKLREVGLEPNDPKGGYLKIGIRPFEIWSQRLRNGRGMPGGRFSGTGDHSGPISDHF